MVKKLPFLSMTPKKAWFYRYCLNRSLDTGWNLVNPLFTLASIHSEYWIHQFTLNVHTVIDNQAWSVAKVITFPALARGLKPILSILVNRSPGRAWLQWRKSYQVLEWITLRREVNGYLVSIYLFMMNSWINLRNWPNPGHFTWWTA